ncbi:hypothetical protein WJX72_001091 [[Myrmecia] bisecta]|uniref:non-specific serine/threonine protein kinase n=1 Tax=[Myrmecia] bisecta TaxID=41462 RepID=A0AAW1QPN1_9CHLO
MTPFRAHLLLLLVGLQVCGQAAAVPAAPVQRLPRPDEGHDPAPPFVRPDDPLLVSLLDGSLAALDSETGEQLWRFDSGSPLVSASGTASKQQAGRRPHTIFPGADGALYSYHSDGALERGVERLPLSVPELVDGSPSMSRDGALVLGSRTSSVYILDSSTGKLVRALLEFGGTLAEVDSYIGGPPGEGEVRKVVDPQNALIMGRHDYVIRSVDAETGEERWNVTYARMQRLTPPRRDQGQEWPDLAGPLDQLGPTEAGLLGMAAGPDNTLVRYDPLSGEARWTVSFNTPAVAAYTSLGIGLLLHGQQGMPALPNDVLAAGHPPRDQASLGAVMVGSLRGSLYALPASHWTPPPALVPADWEKGSDLVGQAGAAGGEGQLVALSLDHARDDDSLWTCPLGMHSINETPPQRQFFLPSAAQPNAQRANELREPKDHLRRSAPHVSGRSWLHVAGAGVAGAAIAWLINYIYWSGKPKATATMTHPAEGVTQMTVDYSGTQQDMQRQREETDVTFPAPDDSKIRDATGSGLENIPEQGVFEPDPTKPNGRRKKARNPRFSNRMNGVLQQSDAQNMAQPSANGSVAQSLNVQNALSEDMIGRASLASNGHDRVSNSSGSSGSGTSSTIRAREERDGVIYVGRMQVFKSEELGRGSNGTIVYGGSLEGRRVAVKRMQVEFVDQARKEIGVLVLSDEHPNVIRCFAMEEDSEFVYLALERCRDSLADRLSPAGQPHAFVAPDGLPTQFAMQIAEDVGRGLLALHERGIVHRDLKPHNVLLTEGRRAKLSDMGLCKQLVPEQSSFDSAGAGGSSGWQAPETMVSRSGGDMRLGKGVDVFSFGLILFYCLTGGRHAFGEFYEREWNILQGRPNLRPIQHMAEAHNLIAALLAKDPKKRPSMRAVMAHPMWWPPATRLAFLIHTSDRVENEDREEDQTLLRVLERCAPDAVGQDWAARLEGELLANLGRYRKYNRSSLRDLLRVVRNKHNHFREMPEALQHKLAPVPEGFLGYFTSRFPQLLLTTYAFALHHCAHEPPLNRYFAEGAHDFAFVADPAGPAAKPRPEPLSAGLPVISERAGSAPATASANEESAQPPLQDNERAKSAPVPNVAIPAVPEQTHEPKSMYSSG